MAIIRIKDEERSNVKDNVFLWVYAKDCQPYLNYPYVPDKEAKIPMVFAILRWDGTFGAIGGEVDEGETLVEALIREVKEEANYELTTDMNFKPLCSFKNDENGNHYHSYALDINSLDSLLAIREQATTAEHSIAEVCGYNIVQMANFSKFMDNQFSGTSKFELEKLMEMM